MLPPVQRLQERAGGTAAAFQERLTELPLAMPQMCAALHLLEAGEPCCLRACETASLSKACGDKGALKAAFKCRSKDCMNDGV